MDGRYDGKTVVVTGGGTGLGRAMAESFAREGARVCVIGRREEKLDETVASIEAAGGEAFGLAADVRDVARIEAVMREIVERAGSIDVLVNNAAGNFVCPSEELSPNGFKSVVDIVLLGTFYCTRFAFDALRSSRGAILNIIAAYAWSGEPGAVHSASAKAGVLAMTRTLAAEWGRYGIRANAIAPGPVHTEGTDRNLWSVADIEEQVRKQVPLGRLGEPGDVARAALWLCSSEASWVSGATLAVDGAQWLSGGTLNFRDAYDRVRSAMQGERG
jgi:NAD(P)-dependent dehydrogenase (short-subunit alcohol dehydrogenase family)